MIGHDHHASRRAVMLTPSCDPTSPIVPRWAPFGHRTRADYWSSPRGDWPVACCTLDMRPLLILGIILIVFGVFVLASEGITYTKTDKVLDIGPIEATTKHRKTIPISPIAGGAAVAAGIALTIVGAKRR